MKNAYDLTKEFISVAVDIENYLYEKTQTSNEAKLEELDLKITSLENRIFEIKNILKTIKIEATLWAHAGENYQQD